MKLLIKFLILVIFVSCSNKKDKNNRATDKIQPRDDIMEKHNSNKDTLPKNTDSIMSSNPPQVKTTYKPEEYKKEASNIITNVIKHKEIPPDGTYTYDIAYAEWQGRSLGEKIKVIIKGNTIKIVAIGRSSVGVNNGEIIDEGMLVKHNVTGDWLITNNPSDANLEDYGGCFGAPMVIDFVNKKYWTC